MPGGRPTKYHDGMPQLVLDYLDECKDEYMQLIKSEGEKSTSYENQIVVNLPTLEKVSTHLSITMSTLWEWKKDLAKIAFSDALDLVSKEQRDRLLDKGLSGQYNSTIAKLILSSNHGMSEKTEVQHSADNELTAALAKLSNVN